MHRGRAQAAVEFLTTYSWALFILFGVVSAIYMLDLGDPDRYAEPECVLDNQITCLEAQFLINNSGGDDVMRVNLQNNYPQAVNITELQVDLEGSTINSTDSANQVIQPGESAIIRHEINEDWSGQGYVSEAVATTLELTLLFEPTDSGNAYQKAGYAVVRAQPLA